VRAKIWLALGAAVVLTLGVTTGTLALFSATTSGSNNTYTAGTLSINSYRDQGDSVPGPMFYTTPIEGQTPSNIPGLRPTGLWRQVTPTCGSSCCATPGRWTPG